MLSAISASSNTPTIFNLKIPRPRLWRLPPPPRTNGKRCLSGTYDADSRRSYRRRRSRLDIILGGTFVTSKMGVTTTNVASTTTLPTRGFGIQQCYASSIGGQSSSFPKIYLLLGQPSCLLCALLLRKRTFGGLPDLQIFISSATLALPKHYPMSTNQYFQYYYIIYMIIIYENETSGSFLYTENFMVHPT